VIAIASQLESLVPLSCLGKIFSHLVIRVVLSKPDYVTLLIKSLKWLSFLLRVRAGFLTRICKILHDLSQNLIMLLSSPTPPSSLVIMTQQDWLPCCFLHTPSTLLFSLTGFLFSCHKQLAEGPFAQIGCKCQISKWQLS
jgi:hypothetical protein